MRKPKQEEKVKGVYEHPSGSGVWWVHYYADGKRHREKAGRKSDAVALYQKRKADARRNLKLPELVPGKVVTFGHLSVMAVEHAKTHLKTTHDYVAKDVVLREPFGNRPADAVTPQEIDQFLSRHCKTPAKQQSIPPAWCGCGQSTTPGCDFSVGLNIPSC